jgi:threonine dehydrogenase-like Zn-dependent dehydrogenase
MSRADKIVAEGPGLKRFKKGDRVIVYYISGCGMCYDCRRGYRISCTSSFRAAYGWQRDGGMASYILAEEKDLVELPDELSYTHGAQVACGFGTVYEALGKIGLSGNDAILVVGLGPVGLATLMLARSMAANKLIGVDVVAERLEVTQKLRLAEAGPNNVEEIRSLTGGYGVERALDASGSDKGRLTAIQATRKWGKSRSSERAER